MNTRPNDRAARETRGKAVPLNGRQKAAIIVRLLLEEGVKVPLSQMPEHLQAALTEQFGSMRMVDRDTLAAVIEEFAAQLDAVGLAFPGEIDGALSMLESHISPSAANRLRRLAGASNKADPWERIVAADTEHLLDLLQGEGPEVCAVVLSKLPVPRAAELLRQLPGEKARRVAQGVARTGDIDHETVRRIGVAIIAQIDSQPPRAFEPAPCERIGAILNASSRDIRAQVLSGLDEDDAQLADAVRKSIFTFAHIPERVAAADIPRVVRGLDQRQLVTALAAARAAGDAEAAAAEAVLAAMPQRMADALREELAEINTPRARDGEAAMTALLNAIHELHQDGEIGLHYPEPD